MCAFCSHVLTLISVSKTKMATPHFILLQQKVTNYHYKTFDGRNGFSFNTIGKGNLPMFELLRRQHGANIAMATTNNAPSLAVGFTAKNGGYPGDGKI